MISVTSDIAERWGELQAARGPLPLVDSLIAATAQAYGLQVVTGTPPTSSVGVALLNRQWRVALANARAERRSRTRECQGRAWRLWGWRGNPSSGIGSQGAAESTNCRTLGRIPGSPSNAPSGCRSDRRDRIAAEERRAAVAAEPFLAAVIGLPDPEPVLARDDPERAGRGCALADAAAPVRRWQRLQWQ